ncbi:Transposase (or an inactivated derivative) [Saccharicrinis carchari]|uniref:Mutator family transposase n=1 Tax=Saccharicrinis carchari TaxID=1168039 RepID=A0A521CHL5_SACCC|nr:IS256 family transposase [Saccharicrinis carchari]SMO58845.1 Transposase (or an inactivated derivative) [Saccharicrinis carchari]
MEKIDLEGMEQKALEQFKSGQSLFGKDGAFAPLLKNFIEKALEAEMEAHLDEHQRVSGNKRNGKGKKTIKSSAGSFDIETPQDRHSSFEPELVKKRQTILADSLEQKIIGLYGLGMSYRSISEHIKEMYDTDISHTVLTQITDKIIPDVKEWQSRPLEAVYTIVWLDAMHIKVKENGKVTTKALYNNILGIDTNGQKQILGVYFSESEGANFWLQVLTDLNNRGVEDILIASIDNLKGFAEAIQSVFPRTEVQSCIVHQIRNSLKYIASKEQKEFLRELKLVYKADTKEKAKIELEKLAEKWQSKYPVVIASWQNNWSKLSTYFQYTAPIRKLIYTTNPIEAYHRQVRKVTKTKGAFANEMAVLKLVYLSTKKIEKKWSKTQNWGLIIQQLAIKFEDRVKLKL